MPTEVSQYPPGSYGAYLDQLAREVKEKYQAIRRMKDDPKWQEANKRATGLATDDNIVKEMRQLQNDAAWKLTTLISVRDAMKRERQDLSDKHPGDIWTDQMENEALVSYQHDRATRNLFEPDLVEGTGKLLGLSGKNPPSLNRIGRNFDEYKEAYQDISANGREPESVWGPRMEAAKNLLADLKRSQQKSFTGSLKSFFVGNSKEYKKAYEALESLTRGGNPEEAKKAIRDYLDLRGNKVRDHQYGRDRFDTMMRAMKLVSRPKEFENFCADLTEARQSRAKGAYKGRVNPADYDRTPRERETETRGRETETRGRNTQTRESQKGSAQWQADMRRIEADSRGGLGRSNYDFFQTLRNAREATPALENYAREHPGVREAARAIAERNGLKINIPQTPQGLTDDLAKKLQAQQKDARELVDSQVQQNDPQHQAEIRAKIEALQRGSGPVVG